MKAINDFILRESLKAIIEATCAECGMEEENLEEYGAAEEEAALEEYISEKKWIQKAIHPSRKGEFTDAAKKAGMSVGEFARHVLAHTEDFSKKRVGQAKFAKRAQKGFEEESVQSKDTEHQKQQMGVKDESVQSKDMEHRKQQMGLSEEGMDEAETYKGKSTRLGGGGRFAKLVDQLKASGKSEESAKAIAASIGRKKYGKEKMKKMAAAGRKRETEKEE